MGDTYAAKAAPEPDPREQELLWTARTHPDDLVLFDLYATRFPGTWVGVVEGSIPADQRNALRVEGFSLYRITLLPGSKAQVIVREDPRPDRDGATVHPETEERYEDYDPRHTRSNLPMSQTQAEREVEPNARYDAVFGTNYAVEDEAEREEVVEEVRAERAVLDEVEAEVERYAPEDDEGEVLTWEHVSVTENPQLLASICSYFSGVSAGEDVEEIRRKLRTADVEWYVNAFLVARGILGDGGPA